MSQPDVYLGVLCARRSSKTRPYQEQTTFFRRLIKEAKTIGVEVFIFSPRDVRWARRRIMGWTLVGGRWKRRNYPFPDAVFDRVSPKGKADLSGVPGARRRFERLKIPMFNTRLTGKWGMYKAWRKNPILAPVLPPTKVLTKKSLSSMLKVYGEVYIKPINGGQGKGVAWAKRVPGGYRYRVHGGRRARSGAVRTIGSLSARTGGGRPRIVQMAIDVLKHEGRPFDVRVLVQRKGDGAWSVTGVVARLGGRRSKVTNIHAGGSARKLREVLAETGAGEEQIDEVIETIERLALETAESTAKLTRLVGELGIDFAIDKEYRCWLLEANSRTGRISFHRAGETEAASLADRSPAEFARHLALARRQGGPKPSSKPAKKTQRDAEDPAGISMHGGG